MPVVQVHSLGFWSWCITLRIRLALSKGPNRVPLPHDGTDPVSEALCSVVFRIPDDGQSPKTLSFWAVEDFRISRFSAEPLQLKSSVTRRWFVSYEQAWPCPGYVSPTQNSSLSTAYKSCKADLVYHTYLRLQRQFSCLIGPKLDHRVTSFRVKVTLRLTVSRPVCLGVKPNEVSLIFCQVKSSYFTTDSQSVCLGVEPNLGLLTRDIFFLSYSLVLFGRPLWREVGSVICQSFIIIVCSSISMYIQFTLCVTHSSHLNTIKYNRIKNLHCVKIFCLHGNLFISLHSNGCLYLLHSSGFQPSCYSITLPIVGVLLPTTRCHTSEVRTGSHNGSVSVTFRM
jgi:hypothetical protein